MSGSIHRTNLRAESKGKKSGVITFVTRYRFVTEQLCVAGTIQVHLNEEQKNT